MSAGRYDIVIDQGSDFALQFSIKEDSIPKDITGYSARAQLRKTTKATTVSASFVCTVLDAANGIIKMELPNSVSAALEEGMYVYDLEIYTANDALVTRLLEGKVTLTPEVTR